MSAKPNVRLDTVERAIADIAAGNAPAASGSVIEFAPASASGR